MSRWYEDFEAEQYAEHDGFCAEGAECHDRQRHVEGTYVRFALKEMVENLQREIHGLRRGE